LNKSLIFAPVALAFALAFIGCSDSGTETNDIHHYYPSFASKVAQIQADFDAGARTVKLLEDVAFETTDAPLIILGEKTLDLNGFTLSDSSDGNILVVQGDITDTTTAKNGKVDFTNQSYFLAPNQTFITDNVGTTSTDFVHVEALGSASVVGATTGLGAVVSMVGQPTSLTDSRVLAVGAGSIGILIGNLSLTATTGPIAIGEGGLYVTGNATLAGAGTVGGAGTLTVSGAVDTSTITSGNIVGGQLKAKSLKSGGGNFGGTVTLTDLNALAAANVLSGTFAHLTGSGAATLQGPVEFTVPSTILGAVIVSEDTHLYGGLTVNGATVSDELIIGGTLTTNADVTLTSPGVIVLDAQGGFKINSGKLETDVYALSGAGSILNTTNTTANSGSLIALNTSGIAPNAAGTAGGTPTLMFGSAGLILNFKADYTIEHLALNVTSGGTITLTAAPAGGSQTLTLTQGGSIVTGAAAVNIAGTVAGGKLIIAAIPGGSLVGGTVEAQIGDIGSLGTLAVNALASGAKFTKVVGTGAATAVTDVPSAPLDTVGSIATFENLTNNY
jgi:hypothetical protein